MANLKATYTHLGRTQSLPAWARELKIPESTLRSRLGKLGLSVEEAFSRPVTEKFRPAPAAPSCVVPVPPPNLTRSSDGRACVRWVEGRKTRLRYLGGHGTAEASAAYARFAAEWWANQGKPPPPPEEAVSVAALALRFLDFAEATFRKRGRPTSEVHGIRAALSRLNAVYGGTPADRFTPERLRTLQAGMEREGLSLKTIGDYRNKVERCFSWGVSRGLVPAAVADALPHAERLRPGRSTAAKRVPVTAAPDADLDAAVPFLHPDPVRQAVLAAVVVLQRLTGIRPGEACALRPDDVDRSGTSWLYVPADHKTEHLGRARRVWFGPRARALLGPLLDATPAGEPVFAFPRRRGPGRTPATVGVLRTCLARACKRAGVPVIRPNQVRHTHGTRVQRRYEDDGATAAALGNSPELARQVYTDHPGDAVAKRIAEELG